MIYLMFGTSSECTSSLALVLDLLRVQLAERLLERVDLVLALLHAVGVGHASVDARWLQVFQLLQTVIQHLLVLVEVIHALNDACISGLQVGLSLGLSSLFGGNGDLGGALKLHKLTMSRFLGVGS